MNNGSFIKLEFSAGRDSDVNNRQMKIAQLYIWDKVNVPLLFRDDVIELFQNRLLSVMRSQKCNRNPSPRTGVSVFCERVFKPRYAPPFPSYPGHLFVRAPQEHRNLRNKKPKKPTGEPVWRLHNWKTLTFPEELSPITKFDKEE